MNSCDLRVYGADGAVHGTIRTVHRTPDFAVLEAITLFCTVLYLRAGNFKQRLFCRILEKLTQSAQLIRIASVRISGVVLSFCQIKGKGEAVSLSALKTH